MSSRTGKPRRQLPAELAAKLRELYTAADVEKAVVTKDRGDAGRKLDAWLAAQHDAGFTWRALAAPIGLSTARIGQRIRRAKAAAAKAGVL